MLVEVRNLVRRFDRTLAVDHVSFQFASGSIYGFIGPNGAGKTTTLKIMSTVDLPDSGDVFYDGVSVINYPEEVRRIIGYMPDALPESLDIQVWEYLDFFARSFGLKGAARTRALADIEEFTNLGGIRHKYLASLSKGMKQRVSLARALVHNPEVLIMDEPAAGLDPRARLELRELLKILAQQGKALLLSSHSLSDLQDICNGAVIIEKGRLLASGTFGEIEARLLAGEAGGDKAVEPISKVEITFRGDAERVRIKLLEHPAVRNLAMAGDCAAAIEVAGGEAAVSAVVGTLFQDGIVVTGFKQQGMDLEEIFMRITTGEVQ